MLPCYEDFPAIRRSALNNAIGKVIYDFIQLVVPITAWSLKAPWNYSSHHEHILELIRRSRVIADIQSLHSEVDSILETEPDGATNENVFTEHILGILSDAGETDSPIRCRFEKENKHGNTDLKINGYAIDENQETLDLFITHYQHAPEAYRLLKADFDKLLKWPASFANVALKGYEEEIEPSA